MIKTKWLFWRADFYPAYQSNQKSFQKALIGWKKAGSPKKPLLFWSCKFICWKAFSEKKRNNFLCSWCKIVFYFRDNVFKKPTLFGARSCIIYLFFHTILFMPFILVYAGNVFIQLHPCKMVGEENGWLLKRAAPKWTGSEIV